MLCQQLYKLPVFVSVVWNKRSWLPLFGVGTLSVASAQKGITPFACAFPICCSPAPQGCTADRSLLLYDHFLQRVYPACYIKYSAACVTWCCLNTRLPMAGCWALVLMSLNRTCRQITRHPVGKTCEKNIFNVHIIDHPWTTYVCHHCCCCWWWCCKVLIVIIIRLGVFAYRTGIVLFNGVFVSKLWLPVLYRII